MNLFRFGKQMLLNNKMLTALLSPNTPTTLQETVLQR